MTLCSACDIWWYRIFAGMSCNQVFVVLFRQSTGGSVILPISHSRCLLRLSWFWGAVLWCLLRRETWLGCSLWPQGVKTALPVSGLTSNCSAVRRCAMFPRVSFLAWHLSTCYACMGVSVFLSEVVVREIQTLWYVYNVMPGLYVCFQCHPRGMVLYGGTSAMGAVWYGNLRESQFAVF